MQRPECINNRRSCWHSRRGQGQAKRPWAEAWGLEPVVAGAQELWAGQKPGQSGGLHSMPRLRVGTR